MSKQENKKPIQEPEPTKVDLEEGVLSEEELETINGGHSTWTADQSVVITAFEIFKPI